MALFWLAVSRSNYGHFARALARFFPEENSVLLSIDDAPPFQVALNDGYWTRFALWQKQYEPEISSLLQAAASATQLFCDLGANKGYWTVRAAPLFDQVIAVEASERTFASLNVNAGHLPNVTLHRMAIHSESQQHMVFVNILNSHASARLLNGEIPSLCNDIETVETLCIDDLVPAGIPALIKLDVEGAEVSALLGATRALRDGAVIIYEDHGSDSGCAPSRHLLEHAGMRLYSCENGLMHLTSIDQICSLKTDPFKGYNFFAAQNGSSLLTAIIDTLQNGSKPG